MFNTNESNIFKLSASLYSMRSNDYSKNDVFLHIIKCNFVNLENKAISVDELSASILDNYQINITNDELDLLIKENLSCFKIDGEGEQRQICLTIEENNKTRKNIEGGIERYIQTYVEKLPNKEAAKHYIYNYLYKLTTSNITTYKLLLDKAQTDSLDPSQLVVDSKDFSNEEVEIIRGFLDWDNDEKNRAISEIVMCCLEYCLCVARYDSTALIKNFVENKTLYLDTNIIFRAIGINGTERRKVVTAFLQKCKDANIRLTILDSTETEFVDTITYHIAKIKEIPRGKIDSRLYVELSDYNIYTFYCDWQVRHKDLQLKYFKEYLISQFKTIIRKYGICNEKFIEDKQDVIICEEYKKVLGRIKSELNQKYQETDSSAIEQNSQIIHDVRLVRYVEKKRQESAEVNSYIISSDKWLRYWAMQKSVEERAVVLFPSQFFLILIKLCGRAQDDLKSFVGFINIRHKTQQLSPSKTNIILSAISSVTEDIKSQESIVETIISNEFEGLVHEKIDDVKLYEHVKEISENYLRAELKEKEIALTETQDKAKIQQQRITELEKLKNDTDEELEKQKRNNYDVIKKLTKWKFLFSWWGSQILLFLLVIVVFSFLASQFLPITEKNFVFRFFQYIKQSFFGKENDGVVYIVDSVLFGGTCFIIKKFFKNPFNKKKREEYREKLIQNYQQSQKS